MEPTDEQVAALDVFGVGESLVIQAGAGCGKTATLRMMAESTQCRGQYMAFNRSVVDDAAQRFPRTCSARTAHSLAYSAVVGRELRRRLQAPRLRSDLIARLLGVQSHAVRYGEQSKILTPGFLAGHVMRALENFCNSADERPTSRHVGYVDGIDAPRDDGSRTYDNNDVVAAMLEPHLEAAWRDVTAVQGGRLPVRHSHYLKAWERSDPHIDADYLVVDEAQDLNPVLLSIIDNQLDRAQLVAVGDSCQSIYGWRGAVDALAQFEVDAVLYLSQCQPEGTMVRIPVRVNGREWSHREVPIESLNVGDMVVSWNRRSGIRRAGRAITDINVRPHDGPIVTVRAADKVSRYAPNHECVAVLGDRLDGGDHVIYMMERHGQYRIGRCPWRYDNGHAPIRRAVREQADALWILSVHATEADAALAEALACVRWGIPGVGFIEDGHYKMSLPEFWTKIGDNRTQAEACLRAHNLLIDHPLLRPPESKGGRWATSILTAAANLRSGMRVLIPGTAGEQKPGGGSVQWSGWSRAEIGTEWYTGTIYSLSVEGEHTYVADGIVTHNSFRFGAAIADAANAVLGRLDAVLRLKGTDAIASALEPLDAPRAILTRTNAVAVKQLFAEQRAGRSAFLIGGGGEVRKFVRAAIELRDGGRTAHHDLACFTSWGEVVDYVSNDAQGDELALMVEMIEQHGADEISDALDAMPATETQADVVISTAHKAKGREWDSVRLTEDFRYPAGQTDLPDEEWRLLYVACTRAKERLDVTESEPMRDLLGIAPAEEAA